MNTLSSTSTRSSAVRALSLFVALGALGFAACSSDDNPAPSQPPSFGNGGTAGSTAGGSAGATAGTGGAAAGTGGTGAGTGGASGGSAGTDAGGAAGTTAGGAAGSGAGGCPTPTTTTEFLNRCSDNSCTPFDNKTRIPGFTGTLPALP